MSKGFEATKLITIYFYFFQGTSTLRLAAARCQSTQTKTNDLVKLTLLLLEMSIAFLVIASAFISTRYSSFNSKFQGGLFISFKFCKSIKAF